MGISTNTLKLGYERYGISFYPLSLTKSGRKIIARCEDFERDCMLYGYNEVDRKNIKDIAMQTPLTILDVSGLYMSTGNDKKKTLEIACRRGR